MSFDRVYRDLILHTRNSSLTQEQQFGSASLGLAGEAGEAVDLVKKHLYHGHSLDREKLIKELGDVRYYMEWLLVLIDSSIEEVEQTNITKLMSRYPQGFSSERSIERKE